MVKVYITSYCRIMESSSDSSRMGLRNLGSHFPLRWWVYRLSSTTTSLGPNQEQWSDIWVNRLVVCHQLKCSKFVAPCMVILKCYRFPYWSLGHFRHGCDRLCYSILLTCQWIERCGIWLAQMWLQYLHRLDHGSYHSWCGLFLQGRWLLRRLTKMGSHLLMVGLHLIQRSLFRYHQSSLRSHLRLGALRLSKPSSQRRQLKTLQRRLNSFKSIWSYLHWIDHLRYH